MKTLWIKNMVCNRCIKVIKEELANIGYETESIELGRVDLKSGNHDPDIGSIIKVLHENGFELVDDKKGRIIDKIKTEIIKTVHYDKSIPPYKNFSDHLSVEIGYDYSYLSSLFSSIEGVTIEKFVILQKIERVKELLVYDELSLSEIAFRLNYSSVHYLSNQFKKITGLTPTYFKKIKERKRSPLDKVLNQKKL